MQKRFFYILRGFDHRVSHFRPLRIIASVLKPLVISTVRYFCVAQKQKGVADAMIEASFEVRFFRTDTRMNPSKEVPCECYFCCLRRKIIHPIASIIEAQPHFDLIVESPNGAAFPYHPYQWDY